MFKEVLNILKHEVNIELKQKQTISSVVLFVISTIFLCYISITETIESVQIWNALFWIILLFSITNAVSKSFINENSDKQIFLYTLISPQALIISKIIYNSLFSLLLSVISYLVFNILFKSAEDTGYNFFNYLIVISIGSISMTSILTMISAIASKTGNNIGIISILGFPIIIPALLVEIKVSTLILQGFQWDIAFQYLGILGAIFLLTIVMSYLLFPYLWKE